MNRASVIIALYGALGLIAIGWGVWRGDRNIYLYGHTDYRWMAISPIAGLAFGLAMVFLSRLAVHSMEWARVLHREFHAVVHELSSKEIFLLASASSVGEELFFRGAMLPAIGLLPSSALFALMHLRAQWRFLPWTIMSFIMGLAMGLMFIKIGDLGAAIVAHFTINLLNLNYIAKTELRA
ncbi:MAG: Abortive infection protein [Myxococcales bacterium]|nr:Abortive infection protein [Myxococcales bacterium]